MKSCMKVVAEALGFAALLIILAAYLVAAWAIIGPTCDDRPEMAECRTNTSL